MATMGVVALGALTSAEPAPVPLPPAAAAEWIPAGEIARGNGLTQPLVGGSWLYQTGSGLETIIARTGNSALVESSSVGTLNELTFENDGSYKWAWVYSSNFQGRYRSSATERGSWSLEGNVLTLTPDSQKALYTANGQEQEKEDMDLAERSYQLVDITLETVEHTGAPMKQFPGIELTGPHGPWDLDKGPFSLDLQRL